MAAPKSQAHRGGQGAIDDGHRARRAAQKDGLGQRPMDRGVEAWDCVALVHQTKAPPPKEKNDKKKLDAAKAIDRPNTI
jgi:hypothetical protein